MIENIVSKLASQQPLDGGEAAELLYLLQACMQTNSDVDGLFGRGNAPRNTMRLYSLSMVLGTGSDPDQDQTTDPFTGVFVITPPITLPNGDVADIGGFKDGIAEWYASSATGKMYTARGQATLGSDGLVINQDGTVIRLAHIPISSGGEGSLQLLDANGLSLISAEIENILTVVDGDCAVADMSQWDTISGSPAKSTAQSYQGYNSILLNSAEIRSSARIPITRSGVLLSFFAYIPEHGELQMYVYHYDSGGALISQADQIKTYIIGTDSTPSWKQYQIWAEYTSTEGIKLDFVGSAHDIYMTQITLHEGNGYQNALEAWTGSAGSRMLQTGAVEFLGNISAKNLSGTNGGDEVSAQSVGFKITKGTTPKTLTVALDADVAGTNHGDVSIGASANGLSLSGQVLSLALASGATAGATPWNSVSKASDTSINNNNTLANDPDLQVTLAASTKYHIWGMIFFDTGSTPNFKYRFQEATGSPTLVRGFYQHIVPGTAALVPFLETSLPTTNRSVTGSGSTGGYVVFDFIIHNNTAGTFIFQWSQNTSDATQTIVRAGSFINFRVA